MGGLEGDLEEKSLFRGLSPLLGACSEKPRLENWEKKNREPESRGWKKGKNERVETT